jgi:hypothetical protein
MGALPVAPTQDQGPAHLPRQAMRGARTPRGRALESPRCFAFAPLWGPMQLACRRPARLTLEAASKVPQWLAQQTLPLEQSLPVVGQQAYVGSLLGYLLASVWGVLPASTGLSASTGMDVSDAPTMRDRGGCCAASRPPASPSIEARVVFVKAAPLKHQRISFKHT